MLGGIGNWWGQQTPQQKITYGLGGLQGGLGLLGLIQGMQRPRAARTVTPAAGPAEQQLMQLFQQRAAAVPTPESVLTDPRVQQMFTGAFGGAQQDLMRSAQEGLRARGFSGIEGAGGGLLGDYQTQQQQLQQQVQRAMLDYALGAPGAHAQGMAPMGNMLQQMQQIRGGQTQAVAPRPTLLQTITQGMAPKGPMQSFDQMAALIGRAGGLPGKKKPVVASAPGRGWPGQVPYGIAQPGLQQQAYPGLFGGLIGGGLADPNVQ
jgi:hypothetical protein